MEEIKLTPEQLEFAREYKKQLDEHYSPYLFEGTKVKFDMDRVNDMKDIDSKMMAFIEEHKDEVLTVEYDPYNQVDKTHPLFVCLKEDDSLIKWLFWVELFKEV